MKAVPLTPKTLPLAAQSRVTQAGNVLSNTVKSGVNVMLPLIGPLATLGITIYGMRKMFEGVLGKTSSAKKIE